MDIFISVILNFIHKCLISLSREKLNFSRWAWNVRKNYDRWLRLSCSSSLFTSIRAAAPGASLPRATELWLYSLPSFAQHHQYTGKAAFCAPNTSRPPLSRIPRVSLPNLYVTYIRPQQGRSDVIVHFGLPWILQWLGQLQVSASKSSSPVHSSCSSVLLAPDPNPSELDRIK